MSTPTEPTTDHKPCPEPARKSSFLTMLGPGIISGAANDDPSAIATYSIAGAQFGLLTLWTSLYCIPLIAAVQWMCARLGMVSGRGIAGVIRAYYPRWTLLPACFLLVAANVIGIGADLGAMAQVTELVSGVSSFVWIPAFTVLIVGLLFYFPYHQLVGVFKWLTLVLFAYLIAAFLAHPRWPEVLAATVLPRFEWSREYLSTIVAVLGATVSPYFLFWQATQEVEEEFCLGRRTVAQRKGATGEEIRRSEVDVFTGAVAGRVITYFITLTTAATLFVHGQKHISTAKDAAEALKPLAGPAAYWLFALGIIGVGMLAVPVLAGSAAYAVAEALHWKASLEVKPKLAPKFYGVLAASMALGMALFYQGINVVQMLFWSSVLNGALAPPILLMVLVMTNNRRIMGQRTNSGLARLLGWVTVAVTAAAAAGLLVTSLR